jgi:pilus assembly protein CpaE
VPASSILLLDTDVTSADEISSVLTGVGYTVTITADPDKTFAEAASHQLLIIDLVAGPKSAIDLCREIRSTPAMAGVPIMCVSQTDEVDERIAFLEAGADDVMAKPFDARELEARVEALFLRFQRSRHVTPVFSADGLVVARARRTVAVFSPKGGVGTTTIATNIAVAKALRHVDRVVLVDLSLQFGGVASHLNLEPKATLSDVVRDENAMREPEIMRTFAIRHDSGLHVLAAPGTPEGAATLDAGQVERILKNLLEGYDFVVVDAGSVVDERSMTALEAAESVVLPVYPEIACLRAMHGLLDYFNDVGTIGLKSTVVLNQMFGKDILKLRDVESALGSKIEIDLPYDPLSYLKAVNEGNPVVLGAPRSAAAERLVKLSHVAFGDEGFVVPTQAEDKKGGRFGFRRG